MRYLKIAVTILGLYFIYVSGIYIVEDNALVKSRREACKTKNIRFGEFRKVVSGFYEGQRIFVEAHNQFSVYVQGRIEGTTTRVEVMCIELE